MLNVAKYKMQFILRYLSHKCGVVRSLLTTDCAYIGACDVGKNVP